MRYRLVAVDLDNTLLAGLTGVSAGNRETLARAAQAGCRVVICTGRGRYTTRPVAEELGSGMGPHIVFNGGATFACFDAEPEEVLLLPREAVECCWGAAVPLRVGVSGFEDPHRGDRVYLARPTPGLHKWAEQNRGRVVWVDSAEEVLARDLVALLFWGTALQVKKLAAALGRPEGLACPRRGESRLLESHLIELSAAGGTKGEALARLAGRLGIARSEIVAIGDAEPDISMIEYAGFGVAVANGTDEVKAAADYVAPSAAEDGVAHVIEKFVLA